MVVEHLERTRDAFVAAADGLSEAQYRFRPRPDAWSIGEVVEHLALAESRIVDMIETSLPQAPAPGPDKTRGTARFTRLDTALPSREQHRIVAPSVLVPKGTWTSPALALAAFVEARRRGIVAAGTVDAEALEHVLPHRIFGAFDVEEWLYFAGLHSARHTAQVVEITAADGFPPS